MLGRESAPRAKPTTAVMAAGTTDDDDDSEVAQG